MLPPVWYTQGDIRMYTVKQQIKRRLNKKSPGFLSAVRMVWDAVKADMDRRLEALSAAAEPTSPLAMGTVPEAFIDKAAFVGVMVKVAYLIITPPVRHFLYRWRTRVCICIIQ